MDKLVKKQYMITTDLHHWLEDEALRNKRAGNEELNTNSKIVRTAIEEYRKNLAKSK